MSIFMKAAENDLEFVKLNMSHIDMVDEKKKSLLHYAVLGSAMDVIHYLLDMDININLADDHGETALFDCARKAKLDIAKLLMNKFASVNVENRVGELPIHLAAFKGDMDMIKLLIESGSYLNKKTQEDKLPVHYAIAGGRADVIPFLLKEGKQNWFIRDTYGNSLLHHAAKTSNVQIIDMLLNQNLDPNALNSQFETPIFNAVRFGTIETIRLLLTADAYIDIHNRRYETPIDTAMIFDKQDVLKYLQEYMITPKYERLVQKQALSIAVLNRDHVYLRKLIERDTPMKKDRLQKTALDYAKEYNLGLCVNLLRDVEVSGNGSN
ncbi:MAG TPA: ankyrin repeat domain-containing protein [Acholeplasmataceae bacterium]|nr:ankyrin repeat domain-containing protein [Acholeplasmataceae bacterium]